jgi:hypothetical protein
MPDALVEDSHVEPGIEMLVAKDGEGRIKSGTGDDEQPQSRVTLQRHGDAAQP